MLDMQVYGGAIGFTIGSLVRSQIGIGNSVVRSEGTNCNDCFATFVDVSITNSAAISTVSGNQLYPQLVFSFTTFISFRSSIDIRSSC
jgi:hypothetical protein